MSVQASELPTNNLSTDEKLNQFAEEIAAAVEDDPDFSPNDEPTDGEAELLEGIEALQGDTSDHRSNIINEPKADADSLVAIPADDADEALDPASASNQYNMDWNRVSMDQLVQHANNLNEAGQEIMYLRQTNQISQQQYEAAVVNFKQMVAENQLQMAMKKEAMVNQRETIANQRDAFHNKIAEFEPEWKQPEKREMMANQLKNFLIDQGATPAYLNKVAGDLDAIKLHWGQYKKHRANADKALQRKLQAQKKRKAAAKAKKDKRQQTNNTLGTEEKVDAIADLLVSSGAG